ncbi:hypothetical protein B0I35DRAFT_431602 [Stachybotrys elegans]|uniref:Hydrophobin n=1 Tax=Stachybotrys elegans TaxID=80388 RepID=A0A8K0SNN5_9HYPO|nr:hypothetical protein B0I35DRAFT_431602 [Stachybotrys elegans]
MPSLLTLIVTALATTAFAAPSQQAAANSCPAWMVGLGPSYDNYCCVYDSSLVCCHVLFAAAAAALTGFSKTAASLVRSAGRARQCLTAPARGPSMFLLLLRPGLEIRFHVAMMVVRWPPRKDYRLCIYA